MVGADDTSHLTTLVKEWIETNWSADLTVRQWWALMAEAGWSTPAWPESLGGRALGSRAAGAVRRAISTSSVLLPPTGYGMLMGAPTLMRYGTAAQQLRLLPDLARGETSWCQLFSEPDAGSDLASLKTTAIPDGSNWIVNGQKVWSSGAHYGDWGMLLARTDPGAPKHDGITFFLIRMDQPGIEVRPLRQMTGASEFNEVFLTDARVSADDIIGELGKGWTVAQTTLAHERSMTNVRPGVLPGSRAGQLDLTVDEAMRRLKRDSEANVPMWGRTGRAMIRLAREFGRASDPVVRDNAAEVHTLAELVRLTHVRANADRGGGDTKGSILKLAASRLAHRSRDVAFDIMGSGGMLQAPDAPLLGRVQLMGLSAHIVSIAGGSDQIQRNIIAERILGLPRELAASIKSSESDPG